jgi:hypothetical protein
MSFVIFNKAIKAEPRFNVFDLKTLTEGEIVLWTAQRYVLFFNSTHYTLFALCVQSVSLSIDYEPLLRGDHGRRGWNPFLADEYDPASQAIFRRNGHREDLVATDV